MVLEGVEFVEIGPGISRIGSTYGAGGSWFGTLCQRLGLPWGDQPKMTEEMPVRWVEFENGLWISRTELTVAQHRHFEARRAEESRFFNHAVLLEYADAMRYCDWLGKQTGLRVRIPTNDEWEAACRAGTTTEWCCGDSLGLLDQFAVYGAIQTPESRDAHARNIQAIRIQADVSAHGQHGPLVGVALPVMTTHTNQWGLYDMHGNAREWVAVDANGLLMRRGGDWASAGAECRSSFRNVIGQADDFIAPRNPRVTLSSNGDIDNWAGLRLVFVSTSK